MDSSTVVTIFTAISAAVAALFAAYRASQNKIISKLETDLNHANTALADRDAKIEKLEGIIDRNTSALTVNAETQERMMTYLERQRKEHGAQ